MRRLVGRQFPQWAHLPIAPVSPQGWDNRSFRLGDDMVVRLPSAAAYAAQVDKEQRWLPFLAARLPLSIPAPLALGHPASGYPWPWSLYRWVDGEPPLPDSAAGSGGLAAAVADFLLALQRIDASGGPAPGTRNFQRGGALATYDDEVREALRRVDVPGALAIWENALAAGWQARPVWVHGDVALGNLLCQGERLVGVIDWGMLAVGDPACDFAIGWTVFRSESRKVFRDRLRLDEGAWLRARGWALWKALIVAARMTRTNAREWADPMRALAGILRD